MKSIFSIAISKQITAQIKDLKVNFKKGLTSVVIQGQPRSRIFERSTQITIEKYSKSTGEIFRKICNILRHGCRESLTVEFDRILVFISETVFAGKNDFQTLTKDHVKIFPHRFANYEFSTRLH